MQDDVAKVKVPSFHNRKEDLKNFKTVRLSKFYVAVMHN